MADQKPRFTAPTLSQDPFAHPSDAFFGGGDRTRRLDELCLPAHWQTRLLLLTGEPGIGKTSFFRALSNRLTPDVKAARIIAPLVTDQLAALWAIIQAFGIAAPADADRDRLLVLIAEHASAQHELGRSCLVMVDDAHELERAALEALFDLLQLVPGDVLRMVLFAEPELPQNLERIAGKRADAPLWHEITLSPLAPGEISAYLSFRLAEAGWFGALPWGEADLKAMLRSSRGLPGRVNLLASRSLHAGPGLPRFGPIPRTHQIGAATIAAIVVLTWLVWPSSADDSAHQTIALDLPGARAHGAESQAIATGVTDAPPVRAPAVAPAAQREDRQAQPARRPATTSVPERTETVTADEQATPVDAPERVVTVAEPSLDPPAVSEQVESTPSVAPAAMDSAPRQTAEPVRQRTASTAPAQTQSSSGPRDATWILAQPSDRFTLQLLGVSSRERADEYLARQTNSADFASFRMTRNGEPWYVVIHGTYPDRAAAEAASRSLAASVGRVEPWIRSFGAIQGDVQRD